MTSSFHDDDDSRRRPPAKPVARPEAPAGKPAALSWGLIGTVNRIESLTVVPGVTGIVRLASSDIRYARPPTDVGWTEIASEPGRYEMVWPADPESARSLMAIADDARRAARTGGPLPQNHPAGQRLDEAITALVIAVDRLQSQQWGVGLLTPAGVLIARDDAGTTAVPVDLGYTWVGDFGDPPWDASPGRPDWLSPSAADNPGVLAWDRPPAEQQSAQPTGGPFAPSPECDLRTLARVIAWALTGTPSKALKAAGSRAPIWALLQEMVDDQFTSAGEVLPRLKAALPSGHFAAPPKAVPDDVVDLVGVKAPKGRSPLPLIAVGLVLLLAVGAVAAFFLTGDGDRPPVAAATKPADDPNVTPPTEPTVEPMPPGNPGSAEEEYAALPPDDLEGRIAKLRDVAKSATDPAAKERATALRKTLFNDWVDACEERISTADPARRAEVGSELRKLVDEYTVLNEDAPPSDSDLQTKEQQWLELYDREAALLGWPR